ncbi:hypothetical protein IEQ34_010128 [Dendrobium chrysotoxum]|uniref:Secreted protein n=1 Tax=Dendrobium chrysotoxum TaxID=161865 RepID=A0AAV7H3L5_DENCH|nr:hypothetical protein IEQ34_010128 [Dendrobium chrysotoxum]
MSVRLIAAAISFFLESLTLVLLDVSPCPVGQFEVTISQARAKTTDALTAIICTSSFEVVVVVASGRDADR